MIFNIEKTKTTYSKWFLVAQLCTKKGILLNTENRMGFKKISFDFRSKKTETCSI